MVANRAFQAAFDPPMLGFRADPYDNQTGEVEADGAGLWGSRPPPSKRRCPMRNCKEKPCNL